MKTCHVGAVYVIISAVFFGMLPLQVGLISQWGGNSLLAAFLRFSLSLLPLAIYMRGKKISFSVDLETGKKICLLTVFGYGGAAVLLFLSYRFIASGCATTVHFVYPALVVFGSILFLKERASKGKLLSAALSLAGIVLFYHPEKEGSILGVLIAFASGAAYAFYILYLQASRLQRLETVKLIFYMNAIASVLLLFLCLATRSLTLAMEPRGWLLALVLSLGSVIFGVAAFQKGVARVGGQSAAILSTFEPLTSLVIGVLFFREPLSPRILVGVLLILSAVFLLAVLKKDTGQSAYAAKDDPQ